MTPPEEKIKQVIRKPINWEYMEAWNLSSVGMNQLGQEGWELVSVALSTSLESSSDYFYCFKRPVIEEEK